MRGLILALSVALSVFACAKTESLKTLEVPIEEQKIEEFHKKLFNLAIEKGISFEEILEDSPTLSAAVNAFVDELFPNIANYCINNGLDPIPLNDTKASVLGSGVTLTEGELRGFSSLTRNGDVSLSYSSDTKLLTVNLPIEFDAVGFAYQYKIKIILVTLSAGELTGTLNNLRINIKLTFDFNNYVAKMEKFNLMSSGHIALNVDSGLVEQVVTILSNVVTTVLHPILVTVIQVIVKGAVNDAVDSINDGINGTFVSPNEKNNTLSYFLN